MPGYCNKQQWQYESFKDFSKTFEINTKIIGIIVFHPSSDNQERKGNWITN